MKKNYIIIPLIMILVSSLGSLLTSGGMAWYQTLKLPPIAPPGFFIGTVWTVIFILSTTSVLLIYNHQPRVANFKLIITFFILNAILNIFWSFLFFTNHLILLSIIEMIILDLTVIFLMILIGRFSKLASWLLAPYAIWVAFATFLTVEILKINS